MVSVATQTTLPKIYSSGWEKKRYPPSILDQTTIFNETIEAFLDFSDRLIDESHKRDWKVKKFTWTSLPTSIGEFFSKDTVRLRHLAKEDLRKFCKIVSTLNFDLTLEHGLDPLQYNPHYCQIKQLRDRINDFTLTRINRANLDLLLSITSWALLALSMVATAYSFRESLSGQATLASQFRSIVLIGVYSVVSSTISSACISTFLSVFRSVFYSIDAYNRLEQGIIEAKSDLRYAQGPYVVKKGASPYSDWEWQAVPVPSWR